jgi:hypothetical protein
MLMLQIVVVGRSWRKFEVCWLVTGYQACVRDEARAQHEAVSVSYLHTHHTATEEFLFQTKISYCDGIFVWKSNRE